MELLGNAIRLSHCRGRTVTESTAATQCELLNGSKGVLWLSESGNKVVARDEQLAASLGIVIDPSKALPDIILVDLGDDAGGSDLLVVFTEVVATDGPINRQRKDALTSLAKEAGFEETHLAFLTAFLDRATPQFKKAIVEIAWGSYVWLVSEPGFVINLRSGQPTKLSELK